MKKELRKKFENVVNVLSLQGFNIWLEDVLNYNKYIWNIEEDVIKLDGIFNKVNNLNRFNYELIQKIIVNNQLLDLDEVINASEDGRFYNFDKEEFLQERIINFNYPDAQEFYSDYIEGNETLINELIEIILSNYYSVYEEHVLLPDGTIWEYLQ